MLLKIRGPTMVGTFPGGGAIREPTENDWSIDGGILLLTSTETI